MMRLARLAAIPLVSFALATAAMGQAGPTRLEFSFSNPGARSMGFGGAFVALADDATAAFANPAGLFQLTRPEFSAEGRLWSYDTAYTVGGRLSGQPTGIGLDTTEGLRFASSSEDVSGLSFFSFVYPIGKWSLALYRHQSADFESFIETQGFFSDENGTTNRELDLRTETDLDFVTHGFSASFRVTETFSLGFGVSLIQGGMTVEVTGFNVDDPGSVDSFFGPNSYLPERQVAVQELRLDDEQWGFLAGFLWQIGPRWRFGGVYRAGATFDMDATILAGPDFDPMVPPGTVIADASTAINTPDVYGLGVTFRPRNDALTFSFEWDRVEYSDILAGLDPVIFDELPTLDDGDELRAGFEYVFRSTKPLVALRAGAWLDPDHRLGTNTGDPTIDAVFLRGDDEIHLAAGVGLGWQKVQVDVGADFSELVDTFSVSGDLQILNAGAGTESFPVSNHMKFPDTIATYRPIGAFTR